MGKIKLTNSGFSVEYDKETVKKNMGNFKAMFASRGGHWVDSFVFGLIEEVNELKKKLKEAENKLQGSK